MRTVREYWLNKYSYVLMEVSHVSMAIIAPFKGFTYNFNKINEISKLFAPPYDVISPDEQDDYYRIHPHNVIRLTLGKKKTGDSDWDNRYTRSADYLKKWESEGILIGARHPSIYLTSHTYDPGDGKGTRTRWGFIALVRIEDEGSGVILPHEKTFSAHKDDRLKLMRACNAQLSQVFALYDDSKSGILKDLKTACNNPPQISFEFHDNTKHEMWVVQDRNIFKNIADAMKDKAIFIADGHHRYETSRNYRNIMRSRYGRGKEDRTYEYIMMYLTDMNDKGLTILPAHRLIKKNRNFNPDSFFEKAGRWFEIEEMQFPSSGEDNKTEKLKEAIFEKGVGRSTVGFYYRGADCFYMLSLKPGASDDMGADLHSSLKRLDVIVLSDLILGKCLGLSDKDMDNEDLFQYNSRMDEAVSHVDSGECQMAFLLNPTRMEQVQEVARNSLIMPRKSTYFYPKVLTGLVFNKIDPHDRIQV